MEQCIKHIRKTELKFLWIIAFAISTVYSDILDPHKYIIPLFISFLFALIIKKKSLRNHSIYPLFFTILITVQGYVFWSLLFPVV